MDVIFILFFYVIFKNHFERCLKSKEGNRVSENCQVTLGNVRTGLRSSGLQVLHLGKMAEKC